jgi:galactose mutarotase-like enzyme
MNYTIKYGSYEATVSSYGAELISLKKDGRECLWEADVRYWGEHAPVLFPVCGKLKNSSYSYGGKSYHMDGHGFLKCSNLALLEKSESRVSLALRENEETLKIYPFNFEVICSYELSDKGLCTTFKVTNTGEKIMPYMFGWHPGFTLPTDEGAGIEDYYLYFDGKSSLTEELLYKGEPFVSGKFQEVLLENSKFYIKEDFVYPRDTVLLFGHGNKCVLKNDKNGFTVDFSWSENLQLLAVWKRANSGARYICLEPWTGTPNDGRTDENFETRTMEHLYPKTSALYVYNTKIDF